MQYVFLTLLLTVYGQLIIKWQVSTLAPDAEVSKIFFLSKLIINPYVLSGFAAAVLASFSWMIAISKLELNYAYPFTSLSFVFVLLFSYFLFSEPISWQKIMGVSLIMMKVYVSSRK